MKALLAYALIGLVIGVAFDLRQRDRAVATRLTSFALALAAWPLWAPVAWSPSAPAPSSESALYLRCRRALAEALRTQVLVARYSGSHDPSSSIGDLLSALTTRVESMDAWFELDNVSSPVNTRAPNVQS